MISGNMFYGQKDGLRRTFSGYVERIEAQTIDDVIPALRQVEDAVERRGLFAVGFVSYEAAPAFDPVFRTNEQGSVPLVWFALYDTMEYVPVVTGTGTDEYTLGEWGPTVSRNEYNTAIDRIKELIASGDTYQVNYTYRLRAPFSGDPCRFFQDFTARQPTPFGAYLDTGRQVICSASPELFFRMKQNTIELRPMKGTIHRGCTTAEDRVLAASLYESVKDRAENTMIVDMVRNDIGQVAIPGSVNVPELFTIERYPTVWQMTSTVTAETDATFTGIMGALFPGASITGAPKARTTEIITELETTPRQVYTGAIGYLEPGRTAEFNIAIRTVLIDRERGHAEYGVGGGIVWDSDTGCEYHESRVKAQVLFENRSGVSLLETIRWTSEEGYFLLDHHLDRLRDSAEYFGYPFERDEVIAALERFRDNFGDAPARVRLLLAPSGRVTIEHVPLDALVPDKPVKVRLAATPVDSSDYLLYHKTTSRAVYERARQDMPDCDDVILYNERGEVTESTIANIVVSLDGRLITPPLSSGLLAGTYRARLLDSGEIAEQVVRVEDLAQCESVYLINSVRGWRQVELIQ